MTTTTNEDLQSALNKHCNLMTPTMAVIWENTSYTPTIGTPHLRTWLLPSDTMTVSLGPSGYFEYNGWFQIDCCYPKEKGWYAAKAKAGRICSHFQRNTLITYNSIRVKIWRSFPGPGFIDDVWYRIPVSIEYVCYDNTT